MQLQVNLESKFCFLLFPGLKAPLCKQQYHCTHIRWHAYMQGRVSVSACSKGVCAFESLGICGYVGVLIYVHVEALYFTTKTLPVCTYVTHICVCDTRGGGAVTAAPLMSVDIISQIECALIAQGSYLSQLRECVPIEKWAQAGFTGVGPPLLLSKQRPHSTHAHTHKHLAHS